MNKKLCLLANSSATVSFPAPLVPDNPNNFIRSTILRLDAGQLISYQKYKEVNGY